MYRRLLIKRTSFKPQMANQLDMDVDSAIYQSWNIKTVPLILPRFGFSKHRGNINVLDSIVH